MTTSITTMFVSVEDAAAFMRQQAKDHAERARATKALKDKHRLLASAATWDDAAAVLEESWIDEIDGDRKSAKLRGRKLRS